MGRGGRIVGRGGNIVGRGGCIVGTGGTGVLFGGLVGDRGAFVDGGTGVLVGTGVRVGLGVMACSGSDVALRSTLWQSGSARSIKPSPSSSLVLRQFSLDA